MKAFSRACAARRCPAPTEADETIVTLDALTAERDNLLSRLQRVSADYVNYQKRMERERVEARNFIAADVMSAMFDVMDDLELAISHARENHPADDPLLVGTDMVYKKALGVFERFGVTPVVARNFPSTGIGSGPSRTKFGVQLRHRVLLSAFR